MQAERKQTGSRENGLQEGLGIDAESNTTSEARNGFQSTKIS